MRLFRRARIEYVDPVTPTAEAIVHDLKHRLYEDPDFKDDFLKTVLEASRREDQRLADLARTSLSYGDEGGKEYPDQVYAARQRAYESILHLMGRVAEGNEPLATDQFLGAVQQEIGELTREVFLRGELAPDPNLLNGAIGLEYPGVGLVVVWDRVRGMEDQLNATSDRLRAREAE